MTYEEKLLLKDLLKRLEEIEKLKPVLKSQMNILWSIQKMLREMHDFGNTKSDAE